MTDLRINERFELACPPLSEDEFARLEALIIKDGVIINPILIWGDVIIDGHNRYHIAKKYGIAFTTSELNFESDEEAIAWIKENAISQRNLNDYQKSVLVLSLESYYKAKAKERQRLSEGRGVKKGVQKSAHVNEDTGKVRDKLAEKAGVSHDTISKVKFIEANADEGIREQLAAGDISIHRAFTEIKPPATKPPDEIDILESAARSLENWKSKYSDKEVVFDFIDEISLIIENIRDKKSRIKV
jgi:ParB-like chromosome segregation protein Spo0J